MIPFARPIKWTGNGLTKSAMTNLVILALWDLIMLCMDAYIVNLYSESDIINNLPLGALMLI